MAKKAGIGLFVGRFQPFHKGHMYALRYALLHCESLVIGIGSSNESGTHSDPLSTAERVKIIRAALKGEGIGTGKIRFLAIPDFHDNDKWFNYIIKKEPGIGIVFSRNWLVKKIFRERGIDAVSPKWHKRSILKAAKIRERIREGREWRSTVPKGAARQIAMHEDKIKLAKTNRVMRVVIGGTFENLHKGHIALISKAFEIGDYVYVGLTTDRYVRKTKPGRRIAGYFERKRALDRLLKSFKKRYQISPLDDKYGPSASGRFDAIVVSKETLPTALRINKIRRGRGLEPLLIVKIEYVLGKDGKPISSSRIARDEIDRFGDRV